MHCITIIHYFSLHSYYTFVHISTQFEYRKSQYYCAVGWLLHFSRMWFEYNKMQLRDLHAHFFMYSTVITIIISQIFTGIIMEHRRLKSI